ncbi:MAG: methyl-accepting chemotaxis protein [Pseudomonadota bacterium]
MNIRVKLTATFTALSLIVLVVAGLALKSLSDADQHFGSFVHGLMARGVAAEKFRRAVDERAVAVRNLVLVTKPADLEVEKAIVTESQARVRQHLNEWKQLIANATDINEKGRAMFEEMDRLEAAYTPVALSIVELALTGKREQAITKMNDECRILLAAIVKVSNDYGKLVQERSQEIVQREEDIYIARRNLLIALCVAALAFAVAAGTLVTRSITRPLNQALQLAVAVAGGDLTLRIAHQGNDEVARLLTALASMTDNLEGIVSRVRETSDSIATGSAEIATGNSDLSQRTEQQAGSLQKTADTMLHLGSTVRNNADSATQANQLAQGASAVAAEGGEVVGRVISTMKGINESSRKIGDIISVIDSIAFQTNILALNAAVEAARAGEQGRGFAVVASEVRNLAQRSAEAAKEIKTLIGLSVEQVEQGTALVDQAGKTMDNIVGSIRRVSDIVAEITSATVEQSIGVQEVGDAVSQMDQTTQQNAALVEQSAAAAESLKDQALKLVEAVAVFKLSQAAQAATGKAPAAPARTLGVRAPTRAKPAPRAALQTAAGAPSAARSGASNKPAPTDADAWETF